MTRRLRQLIGRPRWRVELLRVRGGVPAQRWEVEVADATGHVRLSAELADRPAAPADRKAAARCRASACGGPAERSRRSRRWPRPAAAACSPRVNPAAAAAGLAPGMPLADALSFLPGLATAPAEPAADRAALTRLAEWCGRYSPWTAPDGADGIKIEITGCGASVGRRGGARRRPRAAPARGRTSPTASRSPAPWAPPGPWRASRPRPAGRRCRRRQDERAALAPLAGRGVAARSGDRAGSAPGRAAAGRRALPDAARCARPPFRRSCGAPARPGARRSAGAAVAARRGAGAAGAAQLCRADRRPGRSRPRDRAA